MSTIILEGLNERQREAVTAPPGPVLVLAGPGSGKTRVLTHRIAYLIGELNISPASILAVTFTNKAAREMRERLDKLIGPELAERVMMGTFHSVCARFLRRDIGHLDRGRQNPDQARNFVVYDSDDQLQLMRQVLKELRLDEKQYPPRQILSRISSAKNELISIAEYSRYARTYYEEIISRCYEQYQRKLIANNALDFDDLLVETVRLFDQHPDVLQRYQKRYAHLLIDEYQDTNRAQYTLVKQLASAQRNLFVVGDEAQAIYGWRGADIRNILQFEDDFPDAKVILLEQNYRSTQPILDVAQAIIVASRQLKHSKSIWSERKDGLRVRLIETYDEGEEARFVADEIERLRAVSGASLNDFAVMYRTNAQSRALEEALISRGVPYRLIGGTRFYERKEIKDILAYMRLIHNPYDTVSFERVLNVPNRGIGDKTRDQLIQWAASLQIPPYTALQLLASDQEEDQEQRPAPSMPFASRQRAALQSFVALLDELIAARDQISLPELLDLTLERVNYHEALVREYGPDEGEERWENVLELRNVSFEYINFPREAQLPTFLEEVALVSDVDSLDQRRERDRDAVTLITLHQAKGLEYAVVFLVGLEEGLLPHSRSASEMDRLEEERRLLYVGVTRAKERLYLLYAFRRAQWGRYEATAPSRFLADIPTMLIERGPARPVEMVRQTSLFTHRSFGSNQSLAPGGTKRRGRSLSTAGQKNTKEQPQPTRTARFFAGQKVRHAQFGEGTVVTSRVLDDDEEVTVAFPGKGVKRLLAAFAKLEHIKD